MRSHHLSSNENCGPEDKYYIPKVTSARGFERYNKVEMALALKVLMLSFKSEKFV